MAGAGVPGLHLRGWLQSLSPHPRGFRVESSSGVLEARRVVVALGGGTPGLPSWAREVARNGGKVAHLLDPEVSPGEMGEAAQAAGLPVGVIGGGISAAQAALALAGKGIPTRLFLRHPWRIHRFDADPGWLGPLRLQGFHRESDPRVRREMIQAARNRGSVTEEEARRIRVMERRGCLQVVRGRVVGLAGLPGGDPRCGMELLVRAEPDPGEEDSSEDHLTAPEGAVARHSLGALILATGLDDRPVSDDRWTALARALELPTLADGTPLPGPDLGWNRGRSNRGAVARVASGSGLFVTGRLAELELGPVAGNVAGARMAGMRIAAVAREGR
jgi:cation diffusion facilitator CzcD-associated flavoprotein CzcO